MKMKENKALTYTLDHEIVDYIGTFIGQEHQESFLINVLHKIQGKYGYLSENHMQEVAERMGIPAATISGVATFYHFFRLVPQGKYKISVCLGTACYVKGADKLLEAFKETLGIAEGETTPDGMYSLDITRCIGVCGLAPVIMVNDKIYSNMTPDAIPGIIKTIQDDNRRGR